MYNPEVQAVRIEFTVDPDHMATLKLPETIPAGPAEAIILFDKVESPTERNNGPALLAFLAQMKTGRSDVWKGAAEEIRAGRDSWDED